MELQRLDKIIASTGRFFPAGGEVAGPPGPHPGER